MATTSSTPELLRLSSTSLSPLDYFTDSTNTLNIKSDVILIVDQEKFYCHRLLLSLVSPVFTRMFDGEFKEHSSHEIVLKGKTSESVLELLKYIYPQFHGEITNDNIEDFILLADEYMIDHLKQPCKDVLIKQLQSYKYVSLPIKQKLEQPSTIKSKNFHASDSALDSTQHQDDGDTTRIHSSRRPISSARHNAPKSTSTYFKSTDKHNSSSNTHPRYVLYLDKTQMPIFYNTNNTRVPFTTTDVELWLRRLRILYQIDKGRNYGEVIDCILSILQFIPSTLLCKLINITIDTYSIDEIMLNDIARARMYMLEEWAADGDPYRLVNLTESYRTTLPSVLATTAINISTNVINNEQNTSQESQLTSPDFQANALAFNFDISDFD